MPNRKLIEGETPQIMTEAELRELGLWKEEVEKPLEPSFTEQSEDQPLEQIAGELGRDYGLVFVNNRAKICTSLDGKTKQTIVNNRNYHRLFFDGNELYYTQTNSSSCLGIVCKYSE